MPSRAWTMRMAALMGAGTFGVHQLRFALVRDAAADSPQAHGYLSVLGPVVAGVLMLALAAALARVARGAAEPMPRFRRLWAGTSASLLVGYCVQESVEQMMSVGHPAGLDQGGWVAVPVALAIGLAIALIMRGTAAATALAAAGAGRTWRAPPAAPSLRVLLPPWTPRRTDAFARHLAARGPPAASV